MEILYNNLLSNVSELFFVASKIEVQLYSMAFLVVWKLSIIPSSCHHIFAIAAHKFHCTICWEELFWVLHYSHKNTFARESAVILQLPKLSRESNKTTPNSTMTDWLNLNYGNTFITTRFIYLNMERIF